MGDCRIQLRNRDVNRGTMELSDVPNQIILTMDSWTGSPWTFTRPTNNNKFSNVGSGQSARKGIDYEPSGRTPSGTPAAEGIAQGQQFTIVLVWL